MRLGAWNLGLGHPRQLEQRRRSWAKGCELRFGAWSLLEEGSGVWDLRSKVRHLGSGVQGLGLSLSLGPGVWSLGSEAVFTPNSTRVI